MKAIGVIWEIVKKVVSLPLLGLVYFYKYAISPLTPASCRHIPTCSSYMIEAIKIHGPFLGTFLGLRRISKCHPWGTHGFDPVPPKGEKLVTFEKVRMRKRH